MQYLDEVQMDQVLANIAEGQLIFVSYLAGKPPTERAIEEAHRHTEVIGMARRHYVGQFIKSFVTKKGEKVMLIFAHNRDTYKNGQMKEGAYRAFNPALGKLLLVEAL